MGRNRVDLGFGDPLDDLDLSEFQPRKTPVPRSPSGETSRAAEAAGFRSREPRTTEKPADGAGETATQRRRRTGRNAQFNLKARPETIAAYCALADRMGWGLGETLEKAVELLEERYGRTG
ncbi:stability/partitioning determinant [Gemmobacter lutimaris]|uniref:Stability/partitioning determinant n=1 Tax=Gemmobacter lutimaris TaxID=2306023 RepID=A0A398BPM9_9RHOB|nr:stability/partitioning determinant [Gemmobacter lutimaris]